MDFDPGELYDDSVYENLDEVAEDNYEEGFEDGIEDGIEQSEEVAEFDGMGNPTYLAIGVGLGYEMGHGEIDERLLAENILKDKASRVEPLKVPLAHRHTQKKKGHMTPFARWSTDANMDHDKTKNEIEYTIEERLQIMESEGDWDG